MSRQFDTTGGTDSITFAVGNAPPDQGPITIGVLAKSASVAGYTGWMVAGRKSGTAVLGFLTSNNAGAKLFAENDFGNGVSGLSTSWRWYVMTKAAGSAVPRMHIWDLSGAWTHTDNSANVGDGTGPIDTLLVGSQNGSSNGWRGSIAVVAMFTSALDDAGVEADFTLSAAHLLAASPSWMVRLNQASTSTSVTDDTGGGGDQTALTGTSVDANDPPGYDYSLTPPTFNGSGSLDLTQTLAGSGLVTYATTATAGLTQTLTGSGLVTYATTATTGLTQTLAADGALASTTSAGVVQALTASGTVGMGATLPMTIDLSAEGVVTGGSVETPSGWETIRGAINEARAQHLKHAERRKRPIDCPVHLWPLEIVGNIYHCKFGGHVVKLPAPSP